MAFGTRVELNGDFTFRHFKLKILHTSVALSISVLICKNLRLRLQENLDCLDVIEWRHEFGMLWYRYVKCKFFPLKLTVNYVQDFYVRIERIKWMAQSR